MSGTKNIPGHALQFTAEFQLAESVGNGKTPVRLTARSGAPVEHWYWGKVTHDMSGVKHKRRIPIDFNHDSGEVVGFASSFDTSSGDLRITGELVSLSENDRASEIVKKGRAGVPYEASIFFGGPLKIQKVKEGETVHVNGRAFIGPGTIIRQWTLRGVAITPYGMDSQTGVQLKSGSEVAVTITEAAPAPAPRRHRPPNDPTFEARQDQLAGLAVGVGKCSAEIDVAARELADTRRQLDRLAVHRAAEKSATQKAAAAKRENELRLCGLPVGLARFAAGIEVPKQNEA